LGHCQTLDDVEILLRVKVERWRGKAPLVSGSGSEDGDATAVELHELDDFGLLFSGIEE
jgi:hypothetical protein